MKKEIVKILWISLGVVSLGVGAVGAVLPFLPTFPFLMLTLFCFAKSSERWHRWFISKMCIRDSPYTSSGCTAMCLYCYLVCNYNKCAYLRVFVNREQMLDRLIRRSLKSESPLTFEIGSNSDLVLENTITDNLLYTCLLYTSYLLQGALGNGPQRTS